MKRRSLCGSSHDRCRCAASPEREAQVAEHHVLDARRACTTRRSAWHSHRLLLGQAQHDRDVVRAERPERVLVGAQLAEVQAVAVDVVHVAELARVDQLLQPHEAGVVLEQVADHQRAAAARAARPRPARRRPPTGPAASRRRRACPPRAPAARAPRGSARASRSRPRPARGRPAARRVERWSRAPRGSDGAARSSCSAEPSQIQAQLGVRAARRSCAPGSGPSSRGRPPRPGPRRSRRHPPRQALDHGVDLLGGRARGPSGAPGSCAASSSVTGSSAPREALPSAGWRCVGVR